MVNQKLMAKTSMILAMFLAFVVSLSTARAQDVSDVRWKSTDKVRALYGEPQSVRGPIGTHATYKLWAYDDFVVAFANEKAFHLFSTAAADSMELNEERSDAENN